MKQRTHEFLKKFKDCENSSIECAFGDCFCEFINALNEVDLSEKTLDELNKIFDKDMMIFFETRK